ncbi:MAG: hypothetical protein QS721_06885 [Candidatus Endonucleobacter sp. (ex Gigantidas childressi)]|nr:hypothetical protein [Candidatus Endonucleobacter sp. (ex Gigantidas childressi)]
MARVLNLIPIKRVDNLLADREFTPVAFQSATLLAALAHPDHLLLVGSWGFAYLPPSSNLKSFGYIGHKWLDWLRQNKLSCIVRVKSNNVVEYRSKKIAIGKLCRGVSINQTVTWHSKKKYLSSILQPVEL